MLTNNFIDFKTKFSGNLQPFNLQTSSIPLKHRKLISLPLSDKLPLIRPLYPSDELGSVSR